MGSALAVLNINNLCHLPKDSVLEKQAEITNLDFLTVVGILSLYETINL